MLHLKASALFLKVHTLQSQKPSSAAGLACLFGLEEGGRSVVCVCVCVCMRAFGEEEKSSGRRREREEEERKKTHTLETILQSPENPALSPLAPPIPSAARARSCGPAPLRSPGGPRRAAPAPPGGPPRAPGRGQRRAGAVSPSPSFFGGAAWRRVGRPGGVFGARPPPPPC